MPKNAQQQEALRPIRIALLGAGTVGSQTARLLVEQSQDLASRVGRPLELVGIAVLNPDKVKADWIDPSLLTTDSADLVTRADIVIELIGGIEPARTLLLKAIESGASVVTANKALLAQHGPELYQAAEKRGVDIYFEAAVGGAIPIVRPLRESLVGDVITSLVGIVNGTTNYILDEMTTKGLQFDQALRDAQDKGFAEADPTADVDGLDAAAKAAIMATLAFHTDVRLDDVPVEGIRAITADDIAAARTEHRVIKLLAVAERSKQGISARVYPALIPDSHPLASVHGSFNAVFVTAKAADDLMFYGRGAGGAPTASAVVGDVVTEARHIFQHGMGPRVPMYANIPMAPLNSSRAAFAVRFLIHDKPGVLAAIAQVFSEAGISINGVNQDIKPTLHDPGYSGEIQQLRVVTHLCDEVTLRRVVERISAFDSVTGQASILRVFDGQAQ